MSVGSHAPGRLVLQLMTAMDRLFSRYEPVAYALFRFVFGLLFACHGVQKILGGLGGQKVSGPKMLLAGWIELGGGALIALGLFSGIAAFIASGEMAFAYFTAHAPKGFWPIENKGELAVLYCFAFLFIAVQGSGRYSIQAALSRGRK
jgi:putative oxidoreductase